MVRRLPSACGVAFGYTRDTTHVGTVETKGVCARAERGMPVGAARKPKRLTCLPSVHSTQLIWRKTGSRHRQATQRTARRPTAV